MVYGSSKAEHDANMKGLIERCQEKNILPNEGKACLKKTEISFLGHIIHTNEVKPDSCKVKAIIYMPAPNDVAGVRRFCGIIQYLARFIPNLSKSAEPLSALTRKGAHIVQSAQCKSKYDELKREVAEATALNYILMQNHCHSK